jgi:elongation factor P
MATIQIAGGEMIGVEAPMFVDLQITETDPGFKGDTVQGGTKPATLETGAVVAVPMFLNTGDKIRVDTRDGRYVTRV